MKHIYGIFYNGRCVYVGQTLNPKMRMYRHRRLGMKDIPGAEMRIFRAVVRADSNRIEKQVINAFKRRGQCERNKHENSQRNLPMRSIKGFESRSMRLYIPHETLMRFEAMSPVERGVVMTRGMNKCGYLVSKGLETQE